MFNLKLMQVIEKKRANLRIGLQWIQELTFAKISHRPLRTPQAATAMV